MLCARSAPALCGAKALGVEVEYLLAPIGPAREYLRVRPNDELRKSVGDRRGAPAVRRICDAVGHILSSRARFGTSTIAEGAATHHAAPEGRL